MITETPRERTPTVPITRYVGEWAFPTTGGLFFGVQPESVDLEVHEEAGRVTGTLSGRFKAARGVDPAVRFSFSGDLRAERNQTFALQTDDGAKGIIDLIPGPAINLLEVNFQTELKPGKLRLANFVVAKK